MEPPTIEKPKPGKEGKTATILSDRTTTIISDRTSTMTSGRTATMVSGRTATMATGRTATMASGRTATMTSRRRANSHAIWQEGSFFAEAYERFKSNRQTFKLDSDTVAYTTLQANTTLQYFREDFGGVTTVRFTEAGEKAAIGFTSGDLQVCRPGLLDRWGGADSILQGWEGNHSISCARFHPRHTDLLYAASTSGVIYCCDLNEENPKYKDIIISEDENEINSFDFDANGGRLVTGGNDAIIRIYDCITNKLMISFSRRHWSMLSGNSLGSNEKMHEKRIYCVRCHPHDSTVFISGGWDRLVKVWDTRVKDGLVGNIVGPYIFGEAIDIHKGKILTASCVASNSLELWDLRFGNLLTAIAPTNKRVYLNGEFPYTAQFFKGDPSGDLVLCGGSGLGGLQVISIREASVLYLFEDEKAVLTVDSTDMKIAFGGKSNTILFANVHVPEETTTLSTQHSETTEDSSKIDDLSKSETLSKSQNLSKSETLSKSEILSVSQL